VVSATGRTWLAVVLSKINALPTCCIGYIFSVLRVSLQLAFVICSACLVAGAHLVTWCVLFWTVEYYSADLFRFPIISTTKGVMPSSLTGL
jgi:hypothetical protein